MAVRRHLGFYRTPHSAVGSADRENPNREPNMEWIGSTVCEIFAFILHYDLENWVRGHSRSSKPALFDTARYDFIFVFHASIYYRFRDIAAYWRKLLPLVFGGEAVRFTQQPLVMKS